MTALSVAVKLSAPEVLKNAIVAGIALGWDELEVQLSLTQHILGVPNLRPEVTSECLCIS